MKSDALAKLLAEADAPAPPPPACRRLADAVRLQSTRRRRIRRAGAVITSGTAVLAAFVPAMRPAVHHSSPPTHAPDVAQLRLEIARLDSEAHFHQITARAVARATAPRPHTAPDTLLTDVLAQRESAAAILLHQADQFANRTDTKDLARQAYERVAHLFSDTAGGQNAQKHLNDGI